MISLESVSDPLSQDSIQLQCLIYNSQPLFNTLVRGKEQLEAADIREENRSHRELGEQMLYIMQDGQYIGIASYLSSHPNDRHPWIGLFILHRDYARQGNGSIALNMLEQRLKQENICAVRLAVQLGNKAGAAFWTRHGFRRTHSAVDNHGTEVDVYEKRLD